MGWNWFKKAKGKSLKKHKKVKLGVAFGGGGARGVALIGVIKAFEELGLKVDYVSGTSAGALIGAVYAFGKDSKSMEELARKLRTKDIRNSTFILKPSNAYNIEKILLNIFEKDLMFSELNIPFTAVCTDISSGREVHISSGSVAKAVSGSCAVPGVFKPVQFVDMTLVDGGIKNNVSADVVREMGANVVIAIDLNDHRGAGTQSTKLLSVLSSSLGLLLQSNVDQKLKFSDLVIKPNLDKYSSTKMNDIDSIIKDGYDAVMQYKDIIAKLISKKPKKRKYE